MTYRPILIQPLWNCEPPKIVKPTTQCHKQMMPRGAMPHLWGSWVSRWADLKGFWTPKGRFYACPGTPFQDLDGKHMVYPPDGRKITRWLLTRWLVYGYGWYWKLKGKHGKPFHSMATMVFLISLFYQSMDTSDSLMAETASILGGQWSWPPMILAWHRFFEDRPVPPFLRSGIA